MLKILLHQTPAGITHSTQLGTGPVKPRGHINPAQLEDFLAALEAREDPVEVTATADPGLPPPDSARWLALLSP